jgi:hypothetical protein
MFTLLFSLRDCLRSRAVLQAEILALRRQLDRQTALGAFPWDHAPRYLLRDRDSAYGLECSEMAKSMGIHEVLPAPQSPWQKSYFNSRTHLSLGKDAPISRPIQPPAMGRVVQIPQVGGLHHRYERFVLPQLELEKAFFR